MKKIIIGLLSTCFTVCMLHAQEVKPLTKKAQVSFRGIAVWNDDCVWVSGSNGTVGKSLDGGQSWSWISPKGYENYDFRDIEVFSQKEAVILAAGSPAVILRTADGGKSWKQVYQDNRPEIFFDGMDFKGKEGFAVGDPIDGTFQLLQSKDRGKTWKDVSNFMFLIADSAEAAFAASGTSIQYLNNNVWLGTGGATANIFRRNEKALTMDKYPCPILQGSASQGIFSIDFWSDNDGIAVGGDYLHDTVSTNTIMLTSDGGQNWISSSSPSSGFKSAVKYISHNILVATGTSGTDISEDGGLHWRNIAKESFNSIAIGRNRRMVYLAGSHGNVAKISL